MDISIDALRQNARQAARQVVDDARHQYTSPYEEWTPDELRDLLVQYNIPIRDSANASHEMLVRICDTVFGAEAAESERETIRRYSIEDLVRMETAARAIQSAFFRRQSLKRQRQQMQQQQQQQKYQHYYEEDFADYDCEEGAADHHCQHLDLDGDGYYVDAVRQQSILQRINEQGDDYDEEIEVEWRKPSWKFAKKFEAANRPHRSGKQPTPYDWTRTTLGRHCHAGGCGEQLDLWNEGRTSEFSQFGSGLTNYFKVRARTCVTSFSVPVFRVCSVVPARPIACFLRLEVPQVVFLGHVGSIDSSFADPFHKHVGD